MRRARGELDNGVLPLSTALGYDGSAAEQDFVMLEGENNFLTSPSSPTSIENEGSSMDPSNTSWPSVCEPRDVVQVWFELNEKTYMSVHTCRGAHGCYFERTALDMVSAAFLPLT